jgi:protease I
MDMVDANLVTSRKPDDLPAFNREMIALFSKHQARRDHRAPTT